jgi:hypothetical protein
MAPQGVLEEWMNEQGDNQDVKQWKSLRLATHDLPFFARGEISVLMGFAGIDSLNEAGL